VPEEVRAAPLLPVGQLPRSGVYAPYRPPAMKVSAAAAASAQAGVPPPPRKTPTERAAERATAAAAAAERATAAAAAGTASPRAAPKRREKAAPPPLFGEAADTPFELQRDLNMERNAAHAATLGITLAPPPAKRAAGARR